MTIETARGGSLNEVERSRGGRGRAAGRWALARRLITRDPALLMDYLCFYVRGRLNPLEPPRQRQTNAALLDLAEARSRLAAIHGQWMEGPALEAARRHAPSAARTADAAAGQANAGDVSLGELVYALVRTARPSVVVETGVGPGLTAAYALAALADNHGGVLHSVDLPSTDLLGLVGTAVPDALTERWVYHWGAARRLLPGILRRSAGQLGVFIHDSDQRYAHRRWELRQAWAALTPGGWLVVNDADRNLAFEDVAAEVAAEPCYVRQLTKPGLTGLMGKPH